MGMTILYSSLFVVTVMVRRVDNALQNRIRRKKIILCLLFSTLERASSTPIIS